MTSFFEHQRSTFKRNYIRNLIALASIDGNLDEEELNLIHAIALRRGLKEWQVNELLKDTSEHTFFIPSSVGNQMNLLYDLMQVVYADGVVSDAERKFVRQIVSAFRLDKAVGEELLLVFQAGTPSIAEWNRFVEDVAAIDSSRFISIL
jgi:uncharacterized tellurite resistance protein B-like protein